MYFGYHIVAVHTLILLCLGTRVGDVLLALGQPELRVSYGELGEDWLYDRLLVRLTGSLNDPNALVGYIRIVLDRVPYARNAAAWRGRTCSTTSEWRKSCVTIPAASSTQAARARRVNVRAVIEWP